MANEVVFCTTTVGEEGGSVTHSECMTGMTDSSCNMLCSSLITDTKKNPDKAGDYCLLIKHSQTASLCSVLPHLPEGVGIDI